MQHPSNARRIAGAAGVCVALLFLLGWFWPRIRPDAGGALRNFEQASGREPETVLDPLVLAGDAVVPLVAGRIADPSMPRRREAIRFLAEGAYREAIPVLDGIIESEHEKGYIRCDALIALSRIDAPAGIARAVRLKSRLDDLGFCAKQVLAGILPDDRRSYSAARWASFREW